VGATGALHAAFTLGGVEVAAGVNIALETSGETGLATVGVHGGVLTGPACVGCDLSA
jgi:hypothetical protein